MCIYMYDVICVCMLSCVRFFETPWTIAHQAPLFIGFSRQEYWSELTFPSPGDLPDPGTETTFPLSCIGRQILYHWATWKPIYMYPHAHMYVYIGVYTIYIYSDWISYWINCWLYDMGNLWISCDFIYQL